MRNKKHLVVLTPGFAAGDEDTQSVVFIQNLLRAINNFSSSVTISIIAFQFPFTVKSYQWNGNNVYPLNGRNSRLKKLFVWREAKKKLEELHEQIGIDAIFCCWLHECSLTGKRFALKNKIPFLCWAAGQDAKPDNRYLRLLDLKENEVAVISPKQKELLQLSGIKCSMQIENGLLPELFSNSLQKNADIHVLGAGSLIPLKNYNEFIETIEIVSREFPEIKCEIIGDGAERENLQQLINKKGLDKNIQLVGALPHKKVLEKMCASLIFFHTSIYEGNSTVLLEAAYSGNYLLSKKETALYEHENFKTYNNTSHAATIILNLLKNGTFRPERFLLSSAHHQAEKLLTFLQLI